MAIGDDSCIVPSRLGRYFPSLKLFSRPTRRLFLLGLSEEEKEILHATALKCSDLVAEADAWANKRETNRSALVAQFLPFPCLTVVRLGLLQTRFMKVASFSRRMLT